MTEKQIQFTLASLLMMLFVTCDNQNKQKSDLNKAYTTKTGKTFLISEAHPLGQSLSTIKIRSEGFEYNLDETLEDLDPISNVYLSDLDGNGYEEIYLVVVSAGSGSYGNVIGFASNKDKSLSMINFPEIVEGDEGFNGYMGHDVFAIENGKLTRTFPIFKKGDTNQDPSNGNQKVYYGLYQGEAMWQLKIEKSEILK